MGWTRMRTGVAWPVGALLPALLGCPAAPGALGNLSTGTIGAPSAASSESGAADTVGATSVAEGSESTGAAVTDSTTDDPADDSTTGAPLSCPEGDGLGECNTLEQDCPPGQRCVPTGIGGTWSTTECKPIDAAPADVGEPCVPTNEVTSGDDNCGEGLVCWQFGGMQTECLGLCGCGSEGPECPVGFTCAAANAGVLAVCFANCDPLLQNCPNGDGCYFAESAFLCSPDVSDPMTGAGDPCSFLNDCPAGTGCVDEALVTGCTSASCCAAFCEDDRDCPNNGQCQPFFGQGQPPMGYENVGLCDPP
ncbi:MAG: hypothetical protein AAF721_06525 [Myxococcota bacterium]